MVFTMAVNPNFRHKFIFDSPDGPMPRMTRQNVGDSELACKGHFRLKVLDVSRECDVHVKFDDRHR